MDSHPTHHKDYSDRFIGSWPRDYRYDFLWRLFQAATQINRHNPDLRTQDYHAFVINAFLEAVKKNPEVFKAYLHNYLLAERVKQRQQDKLRKTIEETLLRDAIRSDRDIPISPFMGDFGPDSTGGKKYKRTQYKKKYHKKRKTKKCR